MQISLVILALALLGGSITGCGAEADRKPMPSFLERDAGVEDPNLAAPVVEHIFGVIPKASAPLVIPYDVVSLKGRVPGAKDLHIEGVGNPLVLPVYSDGSFCIDVDGLTQGSHEIVLYGQSTTGYSPETIVSVEVDPSAPQPEPVVTDNVLTCGARHPFACEGAPEICGNGTSDDCDSLVDDQDPDCSSCVDDAYDVGGAGVQANDAFDTAPAISAGYQDGLQVCPRDEDYYKISVAAGQTMHIRVSLSYPSPHLYAQVMPDNLSGTAVVSKEISDTGQGTLLQHCVPSGYGGDFRIRVFGLNGESNGYSLSVTLEDTGGCAPFN